MVAKGQAEDKYGGNAPKAARMKKMVCVFLGGGARIMGTNVSICYTPLEFNKDYSFNYKRTKESKLVAPISYKMDL